MHGITACQTLVMSDLRSGCKSYKRLIQAHEVVGCSWLRRCWLRSPILGSSTAAAIVKFRIDELAACQTCARPPCQSWSDKGRGNFRCSQTPYHCIRERGSPANQPESLDGQWFQASRPLLETAAGFAGSQSCGTKYRLASRPGFSSVLFTTDTKCRSLATPTLLRIDSSRAATS